MFPLSMCIMICLKTILLTLLVCSICVVHADNLDRLLSKHWNICGESLNSESSPLPTSTPATNNITDQSESSNITARIVGGSNAEPNEFPWQISLRKYSVQRNIWYHTCGGVIIDNQWILTAAHCVLGSNNTEHYKVRVGEYNYTMVEGNELDINVSEIIEHKKFNMETIEPDICLFRLSEPISFNSDSIYRPICFPQISNTSLTNPDNETISMNRTCVSTGWGKLTHGGGFPRILQKVNVNLINQTECNRMYDGILPITDTMLCSGRGGKGTCEGDSGGPLQCMEPIETESGQVSQRWSLYGLTSWAVGCAEEGYPSVATRVEKLRDWIAENISS